jgi:hypothetical protein
MKTNDKEFDVDGRFCDEIVGDNEEAMFEGAFDHEDETLYSDDVEPTCVYRNHEPGTAFPWCVETLYGPVYCKSKTDAEEIAKQNDINLFNKLRRNANDRA